MLKRRRANLSRGASSLASAPIGGIPLMEVVENRRILIENHLGITTYSQNEIHIKVLRGSIEITGEKLEILCMSKERIVICGVIAGIRLLRGE